MAPLFKSLFGGTDLADLPEELRKLIEKAAGEKQALEKLVERSQGASKSLGELTKPLASAQETVRALTQQISAVQSQVQGLGAMASQAEALERRVSEIAELQGANTKTTEQTSGEVASLESKLSQLNEQVGVFAVVREELAELSGGSGSVAKLHERVARLADDLKDVDGRAKMLKDSLLDVDVIETRTKEMGEAQVGLAKALEETSGLVTHVESKAEALKRPVEAVGAAQEMIAGLMAPNGPVETIRSEISRVEARLSDAKTEADSVAKLRDELSALGTVAGDLKQSQRSVADAVEGASSKLEGIDSRVTDLQRVMDGAGVVKQEIAELTGSSGAIGKLRFQAGELREQFLDYSRDVAQVREDQAGLRSGQEGVLSRYDELNSGLDRLRSEIEKATTRVSVIETTTDDLARAEELSVRAERQLSALKSLADGVTQKVAVLERQREVIDRTEAQARNLTNLQWDLDAKLKQTREQVKDVKKVHANIDELRVLNSQVTERTSELRSAHSQIEREEEVIRGSLNRLQENMRQATERFELHGVGLDSVSQRVVDLRDSVTDFEGRFASLDASVERISGAGTRAEELIGKLSGFSDEIARIGEQADRVEGMRGSMVHAEEIATETERRLERIDSHQAELQGAMQDLANLRGSRAELRDSLEQVRSARAEVERLQTGQTETSAWLATVQDGLREVRAGMAQLDQLTAGLDRMRQNADRVMTVASTLESRQEGLEALDTRLSQLQQIGAQVDERTTRLLAGLADADRRFQGVADRADDADRVGELMHNVAETVANAERRIGEIDKSVESVGSRAEAIEALSRRADRVADDMAQREQALNEALGQLDRATTVRREATETLQALDEQVKTLSGALAAADAQSVRLSEHTERLEARAGSLRFVEKRLTQFEEKLARMEKAETELSRSLDALAARQGSVDAVRRELTELFEAAEQTMEDVRSITASRDEVRQARDTLEIVRQKAAEMSEVLDGVDGRQQQLEQAEQRLSRADALLMDIRGGLETLRSQKAVVDHAIDMSGQLTFEAKEAEGLIVALRNERELARGIHDAVKELRTDDTEMRAS